MSGFPTKNVIIMVVTVTGWGVDLSYIERFRSPIPGIMELPKVRIMGPLPNGLLGGSGPMTWRAVVSNYGDHKSPNWGCGTPSKWPNFIAYTWG